MWQRFITQCDEGRKINLIDIPEKEVVKVEMNLRTFFGFGTSNDVLGIYNRPTIYEVEGKNELISCPFADTDKRMEKKGWMYMKDLRVLVYKYPGTSEDFKLELVTANKKSNNIIRLLDPSE